MSIIKYSSNKLVSRFCKRGVFDFLYFNCTYQFSYLLLLLGGGCFLILKCREQFCWKIVFDGYCRNHYSNATCLLSFIQFQVSSMKSSLTCCFPDQSGVQIDVHIDKTDYSCDFYLQLSELYKIGWDFEQSKASWSLSLGSTL